MVDNNGDIFQLVVHTTTPLADDDKQVIAEGIARLIRDVCSDEILEVGVWFRHFENQDVFLGGRNLRV